MRFILFLTLLFASCTTLAADFTPTFGLGIAYSYTIGADKSTTQSQDFDLNTTFGPAGTVSAGPILEEVSGVSKKLVRGYNVGYTNHYKFQNGIQLKETISYRHLSYKNETYTADNFDASSTHGTLSSWGSITEMDFPVHNHWRGFVFYEYARERLDTRNDTVWDGIVPVETINEYAINPSFSHYGFGPEYKFSSGTAIRFGYQRIVGDGSISNGIVTNISFHF